jgi:subtilisin family serine protease
MRTSKIVVALMSCASCFSYVTQAGDAPPPRPALELGKAAITDKDLSDLTNAPRRLGTIYTDSYARDNSSATLRLTDKRPTVIMRFAEDKASDIVEPEDLIEELKKTGASKKQTDLLAELGNPTSISPVIKTMRFQKDFRSIYRQALKKEQNDRKSRPATTIEDGRVFYESPVMPNNGEYTDGLLHQFISLKFDTVSEADAALRLLQNNPRVATAYRAPEVSFSAAPPTDQLYTSFVLTTTAGAFSAGASGQWGPKAMNMAPLWGLSPGHGYIGLLDSGTSVSHPDLLRSFRAHRSYNFFASWQKSYLNATGNGSLWQPSYDSYFTVVDEVAGQLPFGSLNGQGVGHGTHVHGTIAATWDGIGAAGQCKNCSVQLGMISNSGRQPQEGIPYEVIADGIRRFALSGVQVINMSFGIRFGEPNRVTDCGAISLGAVDPYNTSGSTVKLNGGTGSADATSVLCMAVRQAHLLDVSIVGASGNNATAIQFPASDPRVIAVGGAELGPNGSFPVQLWDQRYSKEFNSSPQRATAETTEIGSNFGLNQWLVAPARDIVSSFYPSSSWNSSVRCGSEPSFSVSSPSGNTANVVTPGVTAFNANRNYGLCTGTSMAAPHISGLLGIVRSIKPLLPSKSYQTTATADDVFRMLRRTASGGSANLNSSVGEKLRQTQRSVEDVNQEASQESQRRASAAA